MPVAPRDVRLRYFTESDLENYCNYFFRSPPGFLENIGFIPAALGKESELRQKITGSLRTLAAEGKKPKLLSVSYKGEEVGFHPLTHFSEGESGIMHAHFFRPELRGRGIGTVSYVKAIEIYLSSFNIGAIEFRTPLRNAAAMRIKEKLGLVPLGTVALDGVVPGLIAIRFRVDRIELARIKAQLGL